MRRSFLDIVLQSGRLTSRSRRTATPPLNSSVRLFELVVRNVSTETHMAKQNEPAAWSPIKVVVAGTEVSGSYSIDKSDWMTVRMDGGGTKSARGGLAAEGTAKLILTELFSESHRH
jgi:hypothetical protein